MIAIILFYNHSTGIQRWLSFSEEFSHCNIITYDGADWINIECDSTGILTRCLEVPSLKALLRGLKTIKTLTAYIVVDINKRKHMSWKPMWVRSCNELDRYISGVDVGFTINPVHLYKKLIRYDCRRNYEILTHWRRSNGILSG